MDDKGIAAGPGQFTHEITEVVVAVMVINAQPCFDRDRDIHGIAHGRQAITHQRRFQHQAGPETPALNPVRRATDVQVDLIVTPALRDPGTFGQVGRVAAAQLQGEWMFFFIETDQPFQVAMQHSPGGHHFGVEQS